MPFELHKQYHHSLPVLQCYVLCVVPALDSASLFKSKLFQHMTHSIVGDGNVATQTSVSLLESLTVYAEDVW